MFKFFKKQTRPEQKKLYIPEYEIKKYYALYDALLECGVADRLAKYEFWSFVAELFPDVKDGEWKVEAGNILHPYVCEKL